MGEDPEWPSDPVRPGFSGAPAMNRTSGTVLGMIVAADRQAGLNWFVPIEAIRERLSQLSEILPEPRWLCQAERPSGYVHRPEPAQAVIEQFIAGDGAAAGITTTHAGMRGAGGFGKSTLAQAVCWAHELLGDHGAVVSRLAGADEHYRPGGGKRTVLLPVGHPLGTSVRSGI